MRLRRPWWNAMVAAALTLSLIACGDDDVPVDAGGGDDARVTDSGGETPDASGEDAGGDVDAGSDGGMVVEGPVVTTAEPTSVAQGSPLTLTGERLAGASVTIGGVAQTVTAATADEITIDAVDATTPTGTQPIVATTDEGDSAAIDVTVLAPLAVASAAAPTATSVVVTFSRDLDDTTVDAAAFTIAGLTVSAASVSAATVTLTTTSQTPATDYTVSVDPSVADTFGNELTGTADAAFVGFEATVPVITTIAPMHVVPGSSELTLTGTNLMTATVTIGGAAQTITSSTATEIVIATVSASTPLGTQPVIATRGGIPSASTNVEVVDAFRIVSAASTSATSVDVTFNRDVHGPVAVAARFTITGGLSVSAVSVAGPVATLTTSAQTSGDTYTVGADALLTDGFGIGATADTAAFTGFTPPLPTDFVVVRVGNGTDTLVTTTTSPAVEVFLERRSIATGAVGATLPMPTVASGANLPFTLNGFYAEGALTRSEDGRFLALAGYQSPPGTDQVAAMTTGVARVVAVVSADDFATPAGIDTSTTLGAVYAGSPSTTPRSAVVDGTSVWVYGGFGGLWTTAIGATSAPTQVFSAPSTGRSIGIFGGQLYAGTSAAMTGLHQVGTGLPTTSGTSTTLLAATPSPYGFAVFDVDATVAGPDRIYLADDAVGVKRFRNVAGTWTHDPATDVFGPAVRYLACMLDGADVVCLATNPTTVFEMTDVGASSPGSTTAFSSIATAAANTAFRGVAIAPVP